MLRVQRHWFCVLCFTTFAQGVRRACCASVVKQSSYALNAGR